MHDSFIGQLVIITLLLLVSLRPLFKKIHNIDAPSLFAPLAFVLSMCNIFVFGLSFINNALFCLSLILFITNASAIYRLTQGLVSYRYSSIFCFFSFVATFFTFLILVLCIIFKPLPYEVEYQTKTFYTGFFDRGFEEKENFFEKTSLVVTEFTVADIPKSETALLYFNPSFTKVKDSSLRLSAVAEKGIPVLAGDFCYTKKDRNNNLITKESEILAMVKIAKEKYKRVIIVAEDDTSFYAKKIILEDAEFISDVITFDNNSILEKYYGSLTADYLMLKPIDSLFRFFDSWEDFNTMRIFTKETKPHLLFAEMVYNSIQKESKK